MGKKSIPVTDGSFLLSKAGAEILNLFLRKLFS